MGWKASWIPVSFDLGIDDLFIKTLLERRKYAIIFSVQQEHIRLEELLLPFYTIQESFQKAAPYSLEF